MVSTLRQLVSEAQIIKDDRESIERQLKEVKCDMGKYTLLRSSSFLMSGFINTDYSQISSCSLIRQETHFINLKSRFIF